MLLLLKSLFLFLSKAVSTVYFTVCWHCKRPIITGLNCTNPECPINKPNNVYCLINPNYTIISNTASSNHLTCVHGITRIHKISDTHSNSTRKLYHSLAIEKSDAKPNTVLIKKIGEAKHNPPANKEWTNSVYAFNKNSLRSLAAKDLMAKKLVKTYFNLSSDKTIARSKRMRSLIRKSTAKKLYVSSPEVKQTNDKVILTVYTYDRERQFLLRKLYLNSIKWEQLNKKRKLTHFRAYNIWRKKRSLKVKTNLLSHIKRSKLDLNKNILEPISTRDIKHIKKVESIKKKIIKRKTKSIREKVLFNKPLSLQARKKRRTKKISVPLDVKQGYIISRQINTYKKSIYFSIKKKKISKRSGYKKINKFSRFKRGKNISRVFIKVKRTSKLKGSWKLKSIVKFIQKRKKMFKWKQRNKISKSIHSFSFKHYNRINFIHYLVKTKNKVQKATKILLYNFFSYMLSMFNIKTLWFEETVWVTRKDLKNLKKWKKNDYEILKKKDDKNVFIKIKIPFYLRNELKYNVSISLKNNPYIYFYTNKGIMYKHKIFHFNDMLKMLNMILLKSYVKHVTVNLLLFKYSKNNFIDIVYRSLFDFSNEWEIRKFKKEALSLNYIFKLTINRFKFNKFLPVLKVLISKIYNKKIELNIVDLKYPHLNTDIFTEAVATKVKKRVGLLRVMRLSLQLVKIPYKFEAKNNEFGVNKLQILNYYEKLSLESLKENTTFIGKAYKNVNSIDSLHTILKTLYTRPLINNNKKIKNIESKLVNLSPERKKTHSILNKVTSVLNTIKYKWVTGVRLEAAGRLTRRYTAARSVFKFRCKGSLKNTDYSRKLDFLKRTMPNIILRNLVKSNSQHSFVKSKRRIGAFGLKTWMSSY